MNPNLHELLIGDPPGRWAALGFTVLEGRAVVGGITLTFGAEGDGIVAWAVDGLQADDIDGLPTTSPTRSVEPTSHPNGATAIDHVVVTTPDFDRTAEMLYTAGISLKRIRDAGGFRQGFRRLGPAILELVETPKAQAGPARFWGLVITVPDLSSVREHTGEPHPAVQPGRQIATVKPSAGLTPKVAFMTP